MADAITLLLPAEEDFRRVAQLVLGGLGARLDLTYEDLDDLQTALDALLACRDDEKQVEVRVVVGDDSLVRFSVGPFTEQQVDGLDADSAAIGLRLVLETVTDGFDVERREGAVWVVLTKSTKAAAGAAG